MKNNVKVNSEKIEQLISKNNNETYLTDSLIGVLKEDINLEEIKDEYISKKYDLNFLNKK